MAEIKKQHTRAACDDVQASAPWLTRVPASVWEELYDVGALRKGCILLVLAVVWEGYARAVNNPLLYPTLIATMEAFCEGIVTGGLIERTGISLKVLLIGYGAGIGLAVILTAIAVTSRVGADILETLTSMLNPLPAIALLPLALLWFGLGYASIVFVLIHSVLWPVALNTHSGFRAVPTALRMVGSNYGLSGLAYVSQILVPAAFPSIFTGLKIGWAFAWRTLIATELVFGASSGTGGLGWFIYANKNQLEIPSVFAGLLTVILIGLAVENFIFRAIEMKTLRMWGMQR